MNIPSQLEEQQGKPVSGGGAASSVGLARAWNPDAQRRIFICYTRAVASEVEKFEEALTASLRATSRHYTVFRDLSDNAAERPLPGDNYADVVKTRLANSICLLLVFIPDIFESDECWIEIDTFRQLSSVDDRLFFFPIEFMSVKNAFDAPSDGERRIVDLFRKVNRHDFTKFWREDPSSKAYKKEIDEIAKFIDAQFRQRFLPRTSTSQPSRLVTEVPAAIGGGATEDGAPRDATSRSLKSWLLALAAVVVVAVGLAAYFLIPDNRPLPPVDWRPVANRPDLVAVIPTYAATDGTGPEIGALSPADLRTSQPPRILEAAGQDWYKILWPDGREAYVAKSSIPVWTSAPAGLEIAADIPALREPRPDAASFGRSLQPGDLAASDRFDKASPRVAKINEANWYRVATERGDAFFREDSFAARLARFEEVGGCYRARKLNVGIFSAPVDELPIGGIGIGQLLTANEPGRQIERATIGTEEWFRYSERSGQLRYVKGDDLEPCQS